IRDGLASSSGTPNATFRGSRSLLDFTDAFEDRLARKSTRSAHERDSSITQAQRLTRCHQAPSAFIQKRPHRKKLLCQSGQSAHVQNDLSWKAAGCHLYLFTPPNVAKAHFNRMRVMLFIGSGIFIRT